MVLNLVYCSHTKLKNAVKLKGAFIVEVTVNGEKMQLVGNPPEVGTEIPHFKLFDAQNQLI